MKRNFYTGCLYKFLILPVLIIVLSLQADAQKIRVFGYVLDSATYSPVQNATVTNVHTNKKVSTNEKGQFQLIASPDDRLFVSATGYHFRQLKYSMIMQDTIVIYIGMLPHELPGVTVSAIGYTKYQQDSIKRLKEFNETMVAKQYDLVQKDNPAKPGMNFNLDYFSGREKSKRREAKAFREREKIEYINLRFSPELVQAYTGFTGDTLQQFRMKYVPDYDWLRKHTTDEDILYYINDKLKLYYADMDKD